MLFFKRLSTRSVYDEKRSFYSLASRTEAKKKNPPEFDYSLKRAAVGPNPLYTHDGIYANEKKGSVSRAFKTMYANRAVGGGGGEEDVEKKTDYCSYIVPIYLLYFSDNR